jgi:hypothetical protein
MRSGQSTVTRLGTLTVTLNHEWLHNIVSDHLKVGMADPVADRSLGTGEKVIDNGDFVSQEHQTVDEVRSDETGTAGNQDALALGWRQELNRRETREGCVGDRLGIWVKYRLGLISSKPLGGCWLLRVLFGGIGGAWGGQDIMRAKVERSELINEDFRIESKTIEANGLDFLTVLVQNLDLNKSTRVRKVRLGVKNGGSWIASLDQRTRKTRYRA